MALVDRIDTVNQVAAGINDQANKTLAFPYIGDVVDADFRRKVL